MKRYPSSKPSYDKYSMIQHGRPQLRKKQQMKKKKINALNIFRIERKKVGSYRKQQKSDFPQVPPPNSQFPFIQTNKLGSNFNEKKRPLTSKIENKDQLNVFNQDNNIYSNSKHPWISVMSPSFDKLNYLKFQEKPQRQYNQMSSYLQNMER